MKTLARCCQLLLSTSVEPSGRAAAQACDLGFSGGQGRGRTADLPIFSRTLVPTELPGLNAKRRAMTRGGKRWRS